MKKKNSVIRMLALVTQLGISMLAPILMCTFAGVFLKERFNISFIIPLFILGAAAGFRNCWILIKKMLYEDNQNEKDK